MPEGLESYLSWVEELKRNRQPGSGWVPILERVFTALAPLVQRGAVIMQVKEKFGGLRVYVDYPAIFADEAEATEQMLADAEAESIRTCDTCGQTGRRQSHHGWIRTVCDACQAARVREDA